MMKQSGSWKIGLAAAVCALGLSLTAVGAWAEKPAPPVAVPQQEAKADSESLYQQAQQAYQKGELDRAIALLTQSIEHNPQSAQAYLKRGNFYDKQNRSDLAMADYRQVIALDPQNASAYGSLGWLLILEGRFNEARTMTERAYTLAPKDFAWLINLGNLALLAGNREQARAYYRTGIEYIESGEEFEKGPVADLELFIHKGWVVEAAQQELAWLRETFAPQERWRDLERQTDKAFRAGDYQTAAQAAHSALEVAEHAFNPNHSAIATSLNNLAALYNTQGQYAKAEPLLQRALTIYEKVLNPNHSDVVATLNNLAGIYYEQGQLTKIEPLLQRALAINEKAPNIDHRDLVESLNNLAKFYYEQGQLTKVEPLYQRTLAILEKAIGPNDPDVAENLNSLAELYRTQRQYAKAEPLHQRALAIREKALGTKHLDVSQSLNNLAALYKDQGQYAKAEPLLQRALAIREKALKSNHPLVVPSLNNLAVLYQDRGQYAKAEPLYQRALRIRERSLGPDHPDVAESLNNLAALYRGQGQYAKAELLYQRALTIFEKGSDQLNVAKSLSGLALVYSLQGQLAKVEPLLQRVLTIREKAFDSDHPDVALSLNNLAELYRTQGQYANAEPLHQRALAIREKALGLDHPDIAESLNNLAALYQGQGQYAKAELLYQRALTIKEKARDPNHPDIAESLNNLATIYYLQGQYTKAELLYQRALTIFEKTLGSNHPSTATLLNNLALGYGAQGQLEKVGPLHQRALAIEEKTLGPDHPNVATSLNNLAEFYRDQEQPAKAESLYRRAIAIVHYTGTLGILIGISRNFGAFLVQRGQLRDALPHYRTAADTLDRLFTQTRGLSEEARHSFLGQYAHVYREFLELLLRLHEQDAKAGFDREFLAVASRNQSRIFSELLRQGDASRFADDPAFIQLKDQRQTLLAQLGGLREKHATLPLTAPNHDGQKADLQSRIDGLTKELAQTEERLWRDYPRYMELLTLPRPVSVEQLQTELLKPGEVLLSIVLLTERAVAMAVSRDRFTFQPLTVNRDTLTQRVQRIRAGLQLKQGDTAPLGQLDPADLYTLYRDLITPVEPILKDAKRVLVVADGPLYSLPLELLVTAYDETGQRAFRQARRAADGSAAHPQLSEYATLPYLGERYDFRYLPSLAALASQRRYPKPPLPVTRPLIAFADPVFGPETGNEAKGLTRDPSPAAQQTLALLTRSGALRGGLPRLPDTAEEARALAATVPGPSKLFLRQDAQEHAVKALSRAGDLKGLRYLLFATHGLLSGEFLPPAPPADAKATLDTNSSRRAAPPDPRGQPALALTLIDPLNGQDGFLTLKDVIEDLDLNLDLAILSACNTAGDSAQATTGEGFAGLTRAFLVAGARHLWVNHWAVDSATARDLTAEAVRALETGNIDPATALSQAQKTIRQHTVQTTSSSGAHLHLARAHPFFWAPFVTVGD